MNTATKIRNSTSDIAISGVAIILIATSAVHTVLLAIGLCLYAALKICSKKA